MHGQRLVCTVSLPLSVIYEAVVQSVERLEHFIRLFKLFPSWSISFPGPPLIITKLQVLHLLHLHHPATVVFSLSITSEFGWSISIQNTVVTPGKCALLSSLAPVVNSLAKLGCVIELLNNCKVCDGISDHELVHHWREKSSSLHSLLGMFIVVLHVHVSYNMNTDFV